MAEKGFGVKEVNLIGASGTPTITSPNNLNLNANNVAISTNVSIGGTLTVSGNISAGGTITYEDVTNVDSIGIITARSGLKVTGGELVVGNSIKLGNAGVVTATSFSGGTLQASSGTFSSNVTVGNNLTVDANISGPLLNITGDTGNDGIILINSAGGTNSDFSRIRQVISDDSFRIENKASGSYQSILKGTSDRVIELHYQGAKKLETTSSGVNVTGAITVNGSALSIDPTDSDIQVVYTVTANGSSAYRFAGNGVVSTADDPDLYLIRGQKYRFINNSGGSHPFQIREASGGTAYSTGVTNNGASSGNIDFAPTYDSPAQLVYQCTSHSGMVGNIYLRDAAGNNTNVGVTTFSQTTSSVAGVTVTSQGLDHYEEGTFTPFIGASSGMPSVTYGSERGGKYTRIGNIVFYSLGFQMTAYSGGSGNVYIGGFPYVGAGNPGWDGAHVFRDCSAIGLNSRTNQLRGWMETSTAAGYPYLHLQHHSSTSTFAAGTIAASSITTGRITVHGHYQVG